MHPVCPRCDEALIAMIFRGIEIDTCATCHGMWMDAGELEDLLDNTQVAHYAAGLKFNVTTPLSPRKACLCPRCDTPLQQVTPEARGPKPLELDSCPRGHGLWFDRRELCQLLETFPPETGAPAAILFLDDFFGETPRGSTPDPAQDVSV
ncbi:hypothetical protein CVU37_11865 [candidate division BRC1 bacterium HGW-BRC1-1]|jgi:hypothetical protein|nr:MAG: hypothetical protein CVU37_11865 [candidate division BRC1 bacterium HGW-BRC1-1]